MLCSRMFFFTILFSLAMTGHAQIIENGSFESGVAPGEFLNLPSGSESIDGWVVAFGNIDYCGTVWHPSEGKRSIDLDGSSTQNTTGGIAQTIETQAGVRYLVQFDMAGNPVGPPVVKPMRVSAAGQHADFFFDTTGQSLSNMGWTTMFWAFIAEQESTTIEFRSLTTVPMTGFGATLDNVSVSLVGDVNCDGEVDLLDVAPFVDAIPAGIYVPKADINQDLIVDLLDVVLFVELLTDG